MDIEVHRRFYKVKPINRVPSSAKTSTLDKVCGKESSSKSFIPHVNKSKFLEAQDFYPDSFMICSVPNYIVMS